MTDSPRMHCLRLHCTMSTAACGRMYLGASRKGFVAEKEGTGRSTPALACSGCSTGMANAGHALPVAQVQPIARTRREQAILDIDAARHERRRGAMTEARSRALAAARAKANAQRRLAVVPGERFFAWTIVEDAGTKNGRTMVLARCDCGHEKQHSLFNLRSGRSRQCRSCGVRNRGVADAAE